MIWSDGNVVPKSQLVKVLSIMKKSKRDIGYIQRWIHKDGQLELLFFDGNVDDENGKPSWRVTQDLVLNIIKENYGKRNNYNKSE